MPSDFVQLIAKNKQETTAYIVTNYLFHLPLYGYYIFTVDLFNEGDVEGPLMSCPFVAEGPLTFTLASELVQMKLDADNFGT